MAQDKSVKASLPEYGKGDIRKIFMVLAAIQKLQDEAAKARKAGVSKAGEPKAVPGASLQKLVDATGLDKKTIFVSIRAATLQAGVHVAQDGPVYRIADWGPLLSPAGAILALKGRLEGSFTQDGVVVDDPLPARPRPKD
jgi:hypothetical protein